MSQDPIPPRLLLVEDDPTSRSFISEALTALPAQVDAAADIAQAVAFARRHRHALWLVDAHLPDGDGGDCLRALRQLHDTPAISVTASNSREELDDLCLAGFLEVLPKPVSVVVLQATVRRLLGRNEAWVREPGPGKQPLWDESQALAAIGGNRSSLVALRKIFLAELPSMREEIAAAQSAGNADAVRNLLHKLKAGCGFVGATRLGGAVEMLAATPLDVHALRRLEFAASDVLAWRDDQS